MLERHSRYRVNVNRNNQSTNLKFIFLMIIQYYEIEFQTSVFSIKGSYSIFAQTWLTAWKKRAKNWNHVMSNCQLGVPVNLKD